VPISIEASMTNQLLIEIWRASRWATVRFAPNSATKTGAVPSGLMIGSKVIGTNNNACRKRTQTIPRNLQHRTTVNLRGSDYG
jgi:hypothetical protein